MSDQSIDFNDTKSTANQDIEMTDSSLSQAEERQATQNTVPDEMVGLPDAGSPDKLEDKGEKASDTYQGPKPLAGPTLVLAKPERPIERALIRLADGSLQPPRTACWDQLLEFPKHHVLKCGHYVETLVITTCGSSCKLSENGGERPASSNIECDKKPCITRHQKAIDAVFIPKKDKRPTRTLPPRRAQPNRSGRINNEAEGVLALQNQLGYFINQAIRPGSSMLQREERRLQIDGTQKLKDKLPAQLKRSWVYKPIAEKLRYTEPDSRIKKQKPHSRLSSVAPGEVSTRNKHAGFFSMPMPEYQKMLDEDDNVTIEEEDEDRYDKLLAANRYTMATDTSNERQIRDANRIHQDSDDDASVDDEERYCVCRSHFDDTLKECIKCDRQFHPNCIIKNEPDLPDLDGVLRYECNGCGDAIVGVRHQCLDCSNFDLCRDCIKQVPLAHAEHRFEAIKSTDFTCRECDKKAAGTKGKRGRSKSILDTIYDEQRQESRQKRKREDQLREELELPQLTPAKKQPNDKEQGNDWDDTEPEEYPAPVVPMMGFSLPIRIAPSSRSGGAGDDAELDGEGGGRSKVAKQTRG